AWGGNLLIERPQGPYSADSGAYGLKYLILIGDGMADFPLEALDGQTPLEYARTPAMDQMAFDGFIGNFTPIPEGMPAGSDIGNLSLFGYDPRESFTGRAP